MLTEDLRWIAQLSPLLRYVIFLGTWWEAEDLNLRLRKSLRDNQQPEFASKIQAQLAQLPELRQACYQGFLAAGHAARTWLEQEHQISGVSELGMLELAPFLAKYMEPDVRSAVLTMAAMLRALEPLEGAD